LASSRGPVDPDLYQHLFDDEDVHIDQAGVWQPTNEEEFEAMIAEWEDASIPIEEFPTRPVGLNYEESISLAETLGFKIN
jgi:hypothetical protein